jgi:triacylglycerol lipase
MKLVAWTLTAAVAALTLTAGAATAQVPPDLKAKIAAIGRIVDPPATAPLYRPLQPNQPYKGVKVVRDQLYGSTPRNVLDVFAPAAGKGPRPVLIFVPGGGGDKIEAEAGGDAFYDNIMLWAVKHGMTGVNIQRRGIGGDDSATDVAAAIQWVKNNIKAYGGDPSRIFIWGHSAGANSLANYLAHPAFWGPGGAGVKGAVLMAGPYNLYPVQVKAPPLMVRVDPLSGRKPGVTPPSVFPPPSDDPALLARTSILLGLKAVHVPLFIGVAELDPESIYGADVALNKELRAAGKTPKFAVFKDHGHMSEVMAINTADVSTSKPILDWIRSIR